MINWKDISEMNEVFRFKFLDLDFCLMRNSLYDWHFGVYLIGIGQRFWEFGIQFAFFELSIGELFDGEEFEISFGDED
jgi:hypothetical protein